MLFLPSWKITYPFYPSTIRAVELLMDLRERPTCVLLLAAWNKLGAEQKLLLLPVASFRQPAGNTLMLQLGRLH